MKYLGCVFGKKIRTKKRERHPGPWEREVHTTRYPHTLSEIPVVSPYTKYQR